MKLHEYQSKRLFAKYGIPIPKGDVASTAAEAVEMAARINGNVVVKAQVLVGGRGKAGGVKIAEDKVAAGTCAEKILGMEISGLSVRKVLIDEAVDIDTEIYLGITNDRIAKCPVIMASAAGGIDIEEVAVDTPEMIVKEHIHPFLGLKNYQTRNMAVAIKLPDRLFSLSG